MTKNKDDFYTSQELAAMKDLALGCLSDEEREWLANHTPNPDFTVDDLMETAKELRANSVAATNADKLIKILHLEPLSVHSCEDGVMIRYQNGDRSAFIQCYDDHMIGYTLAIGKKSIRSIDIGANEGIDLLNGLVDVCDHLEGI